MLHRIFVGAAALSFALMTLIGGGAYAAPKPASGPVSSGPPPNYSNISDQTFVTGATYQTNTQLALAQQILNQGLSAHLREYAFKIIKDNTQLKNELETIAKGGGFKQPKGADPEITETQKHLAKLQGIAFDKAMWQVLITANHQALGLFKAEAARGSNKELVSWAKQRTPLLLQHLTLTEKGAEGRTDNGKGPAPKK